MHPEYDEFFQKNIFKRKKGNFRQRSGENKY